MLVNLLIGWSLMALCVIAHALGSTALMRWAGRHDAALHAGFWPAALLLVRIASRMILLHLAEIALWGVFYAKTDALPDMHTAMYFSAVTYTTTGYGDVLLGEGWQLVGAIEALTGILMCGWSAAFFFAIASRMYTRPGPSGQDSEPCR
jgi:voltage-gated potassium channel Kch